MTDLVRQEVATAADLVVVKVGTRVITDEAGSLDGARIADIARQLAAAADEGRKPALVSSGAVAAGMGRLGLAERPTDLAHLQAASAVGQSHLIETYDREFRRHGRHAAQLLLTVDDLNDRTRYLNVRNTLLALLEYGAVPVINENDTVSVDELQISFGDNDRLAAMVTNLIRAPLLILLSDIDGLYDGDPADPAAKPVATIDRLDDSVFAWVCDRATGRSKGGMASKLAAAKIATAAGENVIIASGREPNVIRRILAGEPLGTLFLPQGQTIRSRKRWISAAVQIRGTLTLDAGACRAIVEQGRSLLAIGITSVDGRFVKGDVISLRGADGIEIARGLTNYSAVDVARILGLKTDQIAGVLGHCPYDEVIHRDNLAVTA